VLAQTPSDTIDIVRDAVAPGEYKAEEDPRLYRSVKTGRGPLADDWARTAAQTGPLMCAYKLCKVEFRYWGMQAKIEQFIHDVGEHPAGGRFTYPACTRPHVWSQEALIYWGHRSMKPSFAIGVEHGGRGDGAARLGIKRGLP
jgi:hypothetical protein